MQQIRKPAGANQAGISKGSGNSSMLKRSRKSEYKTLIVALGQTGIISRKNCTRLITALGLKGE